MKKNFFISMIALMTLFAFMSCDNDKDDDEGTKIELSNPDDEKQDTYADEKTGGFSFTAKAAWTASVNEPTPTRATSVPWLRLLLNGKETYSGGAGTFTLAIEMDVNYTGKTRSATITIESGDDSITITVTQNSVTESGEKPVDPKPVTGIQISEKSLTLAIGNKKELTATITPSDATIKDLVWTSNNPEVVSVEDGAIEALAEGTAIVTVASSVYTDITSTCQVVVTNSWEPEQKLISKIVATSSENPTTHTITFIYDENNRIKEVSNTNFDGPDTEGTYKYEYSADKLTITSNYTNSETTGSNKNELILNSDGYATKITSWTIYNDEDCSEKITTLEYQNGFLQKESHIYYDEYDPAPGKEERPDIKNEVISICKWDEDSNMIEISAEFKEDDITQNTNKQLAEYSEHLNNLNLDINQMMGEMYCYGSSEVPAIDRYGKRSKNLISRYETAGDAGMYHDVVTFDYTFKDELLTKIVATSKSGGIYTYTFSYQ